jgi:HK97 family phage prohead protease
MKITLLDRESFLKHIAEGDHDQYGLYKGLDTEIKALGGNKVEFVISSGSVDRDNDIVVPDGGDFKHWRKNPVVLFAHNSHNPPVAKGSNIKIGSDKKIRATAEFTPNDLYPFGHMIGRMVSEGFLKATSIGFKPKKMKQADDQEKRPWGLDFEEWELLEFSIVPIPANPEALISAHTAGIDTAPLRDWCAEVLDAELPKGLSRDMVEKAWSVLETKKFFEIEVPDETEVKPENKEASAKFDAELYLRKSDLEPLLRDAIDNRLKELGILIPEESIRFVADHSDLENKSDVITINATEDEIRNAIRDGIKMGEV